MVTDEDEAPRLGRRELIAGGLIAGAAGVAMAGDAEARSATTGAGRAPSAVAPQDSPVTAPLGSPAIPGFVYQSVHFFDFTPEAAGANRAYGGSGTYATGANSTMWASMDIPTGALIRDVEWYVRNTSGSPVSVACRLWAPGRANLVALVLESFVPTAASGIQVVRGTTTQSTWGPHPVGARIALGLFTPTNQSVQVNGARVGFSFPARS